MEKVLRGIVPPLVTPLIDNDTIDDAGLERLIEHVIAGGVSGVFILGTTGEAQSISFELRYEMIKKTAHIVNKRVPLLVGISDTSLVDSVSLANLAGEFGADAVVSAPPYYYATAQPELAEYYEHLIPQLELPIYLTVAFRPFFSLDLVFACGLHFFLVALIPRSSTLLLSLVVVFVLPLYVSRLVLH